MIAECYIQSTGICGSPGNLVNLIWLPAGGGAPLKRRWWFGVFRGRVSPEHVMGKQQNDATIKKKIKTKKRALIWKRQLPETRRQVSHFLSQQPAADKCLNCCLFSVVRLFPKAPDGNFISSTSLDGERGVKETGRYFTFKTQPDESMIGWQTINWSQWLLQVRLGES